MLSSSLCRVKAPVLERQSWVLNWTLAFTNFFNLYKPVSPFVNAGDNSKGLTGLLSELRSSPLLACSRKQELEGETVGFVFLMRYFRIGCRT